MDCYVQNYFTNFFSLPSPLSSPFTIGLSLADPVSQDISELDEWEPFRFIQALVAGFLGTIPINPDSSGRIFGNHQDISEPTRRSLARRPMWSNCPTKTQERQEGPICSIHRSFHQGSRLDQSDPPTWACWTYGVWWQGGCGHEHCDCLHRVYWVLLQPLHDHYWEESPLRKNGRPERPEGQVQDLLKLWSPGRCKGMGTASSVRWPTWYLVTKRTTWWSELPLQKRLPRQVQVQWSSNSLGGNRSGSTSCAPICHGLQCGAQKLKYSRLPRFCRWIFTPTHLGKALHPTRTNSPGVDSPMCLLQWWRNKKTHRRPLQRSRRNQWTSANHTSSPRTSLHRAYFIWTTAPGAIMHQWLDSDERDERVYLFTCFYLFTLHKLMKGSLLWMNNK